MWKIDADAMLMSLVRSLKFRHRFWILKVETKFQKSIHNLWVGSMEIKLHWSPPLLLYLIESAWTPRSLLIRSKSPIVFAEVVVERLVWSGCVDVCL